MIHKGKTLQSPSFSARRRKKVIIRLLVFLFIVSLLITLLSFVLHISFLRIDNIKIYGLSSQTTSQAIEKDVKDILSSDYLGIFPKANSMIYPRIAVINSIKNHFPEIEDVSLDINGLSELSINLKEKIQAAIICADFPTGVNTDDGGDECFLVDKNGILFKQISGEIEYNTNTPVYYVPGIQNDESLTLGNKTSALNDFSIWQQIVSKIEESDIDVESMLIREDKKHEIYIRNPDTSIVIVYMTEKIPVKDQITNFIEFWKYMTDGSDGRAIKSFSYIDLSHGSTIYFMENDGTVKSKTSE
jgi:hypothetical protein